ncbi:hypothetical protein E2C01_048788 [Portunus trituberculatus]|uniref:Uncharacterized protein n=1 Tax=Portunus trituberculatus TaxID=210409 RepID=A0A5B7GCH6_PORTR|nr:hypothetical protein [Portunus trituberculatus]
MALTTRSCAALAPPDPCTLGACGAWRVPGVGSPGRDVGRYGLKGHLVARNCRARSSRQLGRRGGGGGEARAVSTSLSLSRLKFLFPCNFVAVQGRRPPLELLRCRFWGDGGGGGGGGGSGSGGASPAHRRPDSAHLLLPRRATEARQSVVPPRSVRDQFTRREDVRA